MPGDANRKTLDVAVIGTGIAGLSAAWLLSRRHRVTIYESARRAGGHSHTVKVMDGTEPVPVDIGFIVYNEATYPNLTALFRHLHVETQATQMSFGVSLDDGATEYSGTDLAGLFAQPRNLGNARFWSMLHDLRRFYRDAPAQARAGDPEISLGDFLDLHGYGSAFQQDHILPMAAAIWSATPMRLKDYPAASFIRFFENHGLLRFRGRPVWRTVKGGSHRYVERLTGMLPDGVRLGCAARAVQRMPDQARVIDSDGDARGYDQVVIATHAKQALHLLEHPTREERRLLGAFSYSDNTVMLHTDPRFMPRRPRAWSSWNYVGRRDAPEEVSVTYWMNRLQPIPDTTRLFVTVNPHREPRPGSVLHVEKCAHPQFDLGAIRAQKQLWSIQGCRRTWFCGAYFGAGFHEDGLQAGLAVAEQLGDVRRPWVVANESSRIHLGQPVLHSPEPA